MMKLLKPSECPFSDGRGNAKQRTMIVEEQGIDFRTGSIPLSSTEKVLYLQGFFDV